MASKAQPEVMVFDDGGAASPAAAPDADYLPQRFGQPSGGVPASNGSCKEATITGEADAQSGMPGGRRAATKPPREDIISPESTCRGIRVVLDNNNMWNEFFRCKTEMILTKQGSRMFPYCRFRISGLQPSKKYVLMMDIQLVDQSRYMWTGTGWQAAGKAERHLTNSLFKHPESPSLGHRWMQNPVSFYKLKLTSNAADEEGNAVLHPMHRYIPRLHVVQTEKAAKDIKMNASNVATFTFRQTEFMAVTAYHNSRFAQLKVDYNPFAKGLREDSLGSLGPKLKSNQDVAEASGQQQPLKKSLKSLLANHKARTFLDTKSSGEACVQETPSGSAPKVVKNSTCSSARPAEQLIGDLIREAHISLTRCNVDSLSLSKKLRHSNTKTSSGKATSQDIHEADKKSPKSSSEPSPSEKSGALQGVVVSDPKSQSEVRLMPSVKRPLPLPALALFLKKHSTKTKAVKRKLESSSTQAPAAAQTKTKTASADQNIKTGCNVKLDNQDSTPSESDNLGKESPRHISSLSSKDTATSQEPKPLGIYDHALVSSAPEAAKPVFAKVDEPLGDHKTLSCSTLTTSSSSPRLNTELDAPNLPTALPSASKSGHFLSDSPCSPFPFGSLSPVSSPEPLPSLPATFALDLDAGSSQPPERLPLGKDCGPSVFKWHTVLPPPEPYVDPSLEVFQPTSQRLSSLLPSQTPANDPSPPPVPIRSDPPAVDSLSFQEGEQPLPSPGELSPLAFPLTLSPSFSSLDGDALSPTPSIADLVHFFSTEEPLGMGVEFPNTDSPTPLCSADVSGEANASAPPAHGPTIPSPKQLKSKKKARRRKAAISDLELKTDETAYTTMKPNLEEVEEQLFISFTSKEALKLHIADSEEQQASSHLVSSVSDADQQEPTEDHSHGERIASFEEVLLIDMRTMKHQQIIHPVLQEVGLKMNLLDPSLSIDLQYLGVRLPIPPPGAAVEPPSQTLPPLQGSSGLFVSRTGKATDVTQIKGWREKFSPSESSEAPSPSKSEAVSASSEQTKKNLSAFCSDMLDQYLESEAKLIDQRVASFSQPPTDSLPVYELPASGSSYVRTLGSVLKKQSATSPASDLIAGFIPPSKRAKVPRRQLKTSRKVERKPRSSKVLDPPATAAPFSLLTPASLAEPPKPKKSVSAMAGTLSPPPAQSPPLERRKRLKRKLSALQLNPEHSGSLKPPLTRSQLRQKDLEDGAVWAGYPRTYVTEERASISLTSLFTLKGFVSDNPTAPIQMPHKPEPACLNDFCRLGCVCSSLAHTARVCHCGRSQCMLGCSCLKQKVVLLKNLDTSDSSPSSHGSGKKKRKRMKMAYILKEADSVSQPAERVRRLWKRDGRDLDPEETHIPEASSISPCIAVPGILSKMMRTDDGDCARVRRFVGKRVITQQPSRKPKHCRVKHSKMKHGKKHPTLCPEGKWTQPAASSPPPNLMESRPSRRLTILTEGRWTSDEDREHVLKILCEAMAQDRLKTPFWALQYQISPISQTLEDNGTIHHKVLISKQDGARQGDRSQLAQESEPVEAWQREVTEEDFEDDLPQGRDESDPEEARARSQPAGKRVGGIQMALPFLNGVLAAGFLLADKKRAGGGDPIQVNGKMYPLAKIQLGEMGALHPANRLAAYLTGRVAATRKQQQQQQQLIPNTQKMSSWSHQLTYPSATSASIATATPITTSAPTATSTPIATSTPLATFAPIATSTPTTTFTPFTPTATFTLSGPSRPSSTFTSPAAAMPSASFTSSATFTPTSATLPNPTTPSATLTSPAASLPSADSTPMVASTPVAASPPIVVPTPVPPPTQTAAITSTAASTATATAVSTATRTPGSTSAPIATSVSTPAFTYYVVPPPSSGSAAVPLPGPRAVTATRQTVPSSTTVRMILRQVRTPTGFRYYRRPDGKLVQLIPINNLRPAAPIKIESPIVRGASSLKTPASSVVGPALPSPASGLKPFTVNSSPLSAASSQNSGIHTFLPPTSTKQDVDGNVTSLLPDEVTVPVSAEETTPVTVKASAPDLVISEVRSMQPLTEAPTLPGSPKDVAAPTPGGTSAESGVSPAGPPSSSSPEPARDLADLDVVCIVDDDDDDVRKRERVVHIDLVDSSSDETDHSSDLRGDSNDQEKSRSVEDKAVHNSLERRRRHRLAEMVSGLKKELRLDPVASTVTALREAVLMIEELRATEKHLRRVKMGLTRRRDRLMAVLLPLLPGSQCNSFPTESLDGPEDVTEKIGSDNEINGSGDIIRLTLSPSPEPRPASPPSNAQPAPAVSSATPECQATLDHSAAPLSGDDVVFVSSTLTLPKERAPPAPAPPPPSLKAAAVENQPEVAAATGPHWPPATAKHRPKTVPNILSRCKSLPSLPPASGQPDSLQAILAPEIVSALPGQPFLTLTSLTSDCTRPPSSSAPTVDKPNTLIPPAPPTTPPPECRPDPGDEGHALAPPPLLHMKAGGAQMERPSPAEAPAPPGEGVSWRPMPRLVPLGLRGAPPS